METAPNYMRTTPSPPMLAIGWPHLHHRLVLAPCPAGMLVLGVGS
jgi:hypothetical protein